MNKVSENISKNMGMPIIKGLAISVIITLISVFIFSFIVSYTDFAESEIPKVLIGITAISILIGTSVSTLKLNKNGIINGGTIGFIYMISLYVLSSCLGTGFTLNISAIVMMLLGIIAGMIGGIVGVNIKS